MAFRTAPNAVLIGFWAKPDILDRNMSTYDIWDRKEKYMYNLSSNSWKEDIGLRDLGLESGIVISSILRNRVSGNGLNSAGSE